MKLFLCFVAATLLYWGCTALLGPAGITVNILLVFSLAVCVFQPPVCGYLTAFICGLFLDFLGVRLFGHEAFLFTCCALAVYSSKERFDYESELPQMVCVFVLGLLTAIGHIWLLKIVTGVFAWNGVLPLLAGVLLSSLVAPLIFKGIRRIFADKNQI